MKKILIFGATGTTGAYVVDYLYNYLNSSEYELIAVSKRDTDFFSREYGIEYIKVDISCKRDFEKLPQTDVYAIIFMAGILPAYMEGYQPEKYIETNTIGGINALEYARKTNTEKFIYTQSISDLAGYFGVEKELFPDMPIKLNYTNDHSVYVISKVAVVELMKNYSQMYGLNCIVLRMPNIYMYTKNQMFCVNGKIKPIAYLYIINRAISGKKIEIWGDPKISKDIVYVKDFAQMVYKSILTKERNKTYNVGTGKGTTLEEQILGIRDVFCENKISEVVYCPEKSNNPEYIMNIDLAVKELGYLPKYNYMDLLKDMKAEMNEKKYDELEKSFT